MLSKPELILRYLDTKGTGIIRWRELYQSFMVATQWNNKTVNSEIERYAGVSLDRYVCYIVQGRKIYFHHAILSNTGTMQKFLWIKKSFANPTEMY